MIKRDNLFFYNRSWVVLSVGTQARDSLGPSTHVIFVHSAALYHFGRIGRIGRTLGFLSRS
jgi:hypothetical protein